MKKQISARYLGKEEGKLIGVITNKDFNKFIEIRRSFVETNTNWKLTSSMIDEAVSQLDFEKTFETGCKQNVYALLENGVVKFNSSLKNDRSLELMVSEVYFEKEEYAF